MFCDISCLTNNVFSTTTTANRKYALQNQNILIGYNIFLHEFPKSTFLNNKYDKILHNRDNLAIVKSRASSKVKCIS